MRALLDTHTFLWWNKNDPQLSEAAKEFITNGKNEIFVSSATGWEIALKYAKGRLVLPLPPDRYIAERVTTHRFIPLPIKMSHAVEIYKLPMIHTDPFDRLLIAQSHLDDLPLLTADSSIAKYDVAIIW